MTFLKLKFEGVQLFHKPYPKHLGVVLDRSLTFKEHISKNSNKLNSRINIIQKPAEVSWGAHTQVLKTSSMSLVYSTAEYCAPVLEKQHSYKIN